MPILIPAAQSRYFMQGLPPLDTESMDNFNNPDYGPLTDLKFLPDDNEPRRIYRRQSERQGHPRISGVDDDDYDTIEAKPQTKESELVWTAS